jgi:dihydrofolate reductase
MYKLMVDYWPKEDAQTSNLEYIVEYARIWKDKPKVVFSKTLDMVGWNSRLVRDNVVEEITKLKVQPGKDLSVGGPGLASALIQNGLVDEYQLFVNPVVLGGGTPFFPVLSDPISLRLIGSRVFGSGVVYPAYQTEGMGPK